MCLTSEPQDYDSTLANNVVLLASSGGDLQNVVEDSQLSVMWLE